MLRTRSLLVALALLLPLVGCSTSQTRDVWVSPAVTPETPRSIAIVAIDQTGRLGPQSGQLINAEDRIAAEFGRRGYETTLQSNFRQYVEQQTLRQSGLTDADYAKAALHSDADAILIARVTRCDVWNNQNKNLIPINFNGQRMGPSFMAGATVSLRMIDSRTAATLFTATSDAEESVPDTHTRGAVVDNAAAQAARELPARMAAVTVESGSAPAEIYVNGNRMGTTPTTLQLRPSEPVTIELRAMGYQSESLFYTPKHEDRIRRSLKQSPLAAR